MVDVDKALKLRNRNVNVIVHQLLLEFKAPIKIPPT